MSIRYRHCGLVLALACIVTLAVAGVVAGQSGQYDISVPGSIETPETDITVDGDTYTVTAVFQADPGDSMDVTVEAPDDQLVDVYIYNSDRQIVTSREQEGSGSVTFDLSGYTVGSYSVVLQYDGENKAVQPVIVRAYDVSADIPTAATEGGTVTLSATLTELRDASSSGIEFVISDDDTVRRITATEENSEYTVTTALTSLDAGDYSVYATVRGTKEVDGRRIRLGLSSPETLTLNSAEQTPDDGGSSGGGGGGGGGGSTTGDDTTATTSTQTPSGTTVAPPPTASDRTTVPSPTVSDRTAVSETTQPAGSTDSAVGSKTTEQAGPVVTTEATGGPITPSAPSPTDDTTETPGGSSPGFTLVGTIVALLLGVSLRMAGE